MLLLPELQLHNERGAVSDAQALDRVLEACYEDANGTLFTPRTRIWSQWVLHVAAFGDACNPQVHKPDENYPHATPIQPQLIARIVP